MFLSVIIPVKTQWYQGRRMYLGLEPARCTVILYRQGGMQKITRAPYSWFSILLASTPPVQKATLEIEVHATRSISRKKVITAYGYSSYSEGNGIAFDHSPISAPWSLACLFLMFIYHTTAARHIGHKPDLWRAEDRGLLQPRELIFFLMLF